MNEFIQTLHKKLYLIEDVLILAKYLVGEQVIRSSLTASAAGAQQCDLGNSQCLHCATVQGLRGQGKCGNTCSEKRKAA